MTAPYQFIPAGAVVLLDDEFVGAHLAWRQHAGGHTDGPNMKYFIEWASNKMKESKK